MPVLIAVVVLSFVAGLLARPPVAIAIALSLGVLANAVFVWAIADGKGDDPAWIILVSLAAAAVAVGAARLASSLRSSRQDASA